MPARLEKRECWPFQRVADCYHFAVEIDEFIERELKVSEVRNLSIVHPQAMIRSGLRAMLAEQAQLAVSDSSVDAARPELPYDVVIADCDSFLNGDISVRVDGCGTCPLILLAPEVMQERLRAALFLGARGFLTPDCSKEELLRAVQLVAAGHTYFDALAMRSLASGAITPRLTPRELDVLRAMALGKSNKLIATMLGIECWTVKSHIKSLTRKMNVQNRTGAVVAGIKFGLIYQPA
jgi:two-component system nitrate/nitrite response regulator NarL